MQTVHSIYHLRKALAIIASDSKIYIKVMFLRQMFRDHDMVIFTRKKKIFPEYICEIKYLQGISKGRVKWKVEDKKKSRVVIMPMNFLGLLYVLKSYRRGDPKSHRETSVHYYFYCICHLEIFKSRWKD